MRVLPRADRGSLHGGNVGIGTTAPGAKLDVAGVVRYGSAASNGQLSYGGAGLVTLEGVSANTSIALLPTGTGKVGIGSTSPTAALDVSGDIKVSGSIAVESWNTPTFENGWTNYGGGWEPAGYYKDKFGMVHLKGLVKSGTLSTAVFTLPVGSRPNYGRHIATLSANGITACILYIYSNGTVVPAANCSSSWTSLEISFKP